MKKALALPLLERQGLGILRYAKPRVSATVTISRQQSQEPAVGCAVLLSTRHNCPVGHCPRQATTDPTQRCLLWNSSILTGKKKPEKQVLAGLTQSPEKIMQSHYTGPANSQTTNQPVLRGNRTPTALASLLPVTNTINPIFRIWFLAQSHAPLSSILINFPGTE